MKIKIIIVVVFLLFLIGGIIGYSEYKKTNKYMARRLKELGLTNEDVSGFENEFLKTWLNSAENHYKEEGNKPGWMDGWKFYYKDKDYFLKGGTADPDRGMYS